MRSKGREQPLPWLDLMRFVAAFLVVFSHARTLVFVRYGGLDPDSQGVGTMLWFAAARLGSEAVVLFFVLSGYLVGGKVWERCRQGDFNARLYAIDRATRIMLPLLLILVLTLFLRRWIEHDWFFEEFFANVFSLQGITLPELGYNHPLWSLPYELWCYVLALGVGLVWTGRWATGVALVVFSLLLFFVYLVPWYTVVWLMGAGVYIWRDRFRSPCLLSIAILICSYGWISFQFADGVLPDTWLAKSPLVLGYYKSTIVLGFGFALLVHQLAQMPPRSTGAKRVNRVGHWLAASSYSLYLSHFVVLQVLDWKVLEPSPYITADNLFALLWVLVLCQVVALMIYQLSERHTDRVRGWLKQILP